MPTAYEPKTGRSKFTQERRGRILEAFACGASLQTAAALARVSHGTLIRWLKKGEDAPEDSQWNKFYLECQEARALPTERALRIVHDAMPDYPMLAWKYIERREPGFAPPTIGAPPSSGPVVIQLSFSDGSAVTERMKPPSLGIPADEVIDIEPTEPAALPTP
jgi:hypothetical protein